VQGIGSRCGRNWSRARTRARIEVIEFDAYVWLLTDPVTAVGIAPLADVPCLPELPALIRAKYATTVNRWRTLRVQSPPADTLSNAVGGDLSRSLMWRDVLSRYGIGDVASVVFADQFGCWGFLDLWRNHTSEPFSAARTGRPDAQRRAANRQSRSSFARVAGCAASACA